VRIQSMVNNGRLHNDCLIDKDDGLHSERGFPAFHILPTAIIRVPELRCVHTIVHFFLVPFIGEGSVDAQV